MGIGPGVKILQKNQPEFPSCRLGLALFLTSLCAWWCGPAPSKGERRSARPGPTRSYRRNVGRCRAIQFLRLVVRTRPRPEARVGQARTHSLVETRCGSLPRISFLVYASARTRSPKEMRVSQAGPTRSCRRDVGRCRVFFRFANRVRPACLHRLTSGLTGLNKN